MGATEATIAAIAVAALLALLLRHVTPIRSIRADGTRAWQLRRARALTTEPAAGPGQALVWIVSGLPAIASDAHHLVVDTGAARAAMSPEGAERIGLSAALFQRDLFSSRLRGFGREAPPTQKRLALLDQRFGTLHFPQITFTLGEHLTGLDGLLGLAQFVDHVLCLDLQRNRLSLHDHLDSFRSTHRWLRSAQPAPFLIDSKSSVFVQGELDGRPVHIAIDTGAHITSIDPARLSIPTPTNAPSISGGIGIQGECGAVPVCELGHLRIGSASFDPALVASQPLRNAPINLGADRLWGRVLIVDFTYRRVWISPPGARPSQVKSIEDRLAEQGLE